VEINYYFLVLQIRKNNVFLFVTSKDGKLIVLKSAGNCGFKDKRKLSLELLSILIYNLIQSLKNIHLMKFFLKIDGTLKQDLFLALVNLLCKYKLTILGVSFQSKITFNGCRLKIK